DGIKLRFGVSAARPETVIPDVEWLQRAAQARLDELSHLRHKWRRQDLLKHRFDAILRDLALFVKTPRNECGSSRRIGVRLLDRCEILEQHRITRVRFGSIAHR